MNTIAEKAIYSASFISGGLLVGAVALSFSIVQAAPGELNSINNGQNVLAGTYFNTPGSRTTFQNPGGGLRIGPGVLVRGLESNANRAPNGNGGTLYFRAPGNVVRLDGSIDVSAVRNGSLYTGSGGKVFIDSGYFFQNGSIFANGANGGLVQLNVGGLTLTNNARMTAQGFGGNGGSINIGSTGTVDLQSGSLLETSGKVGGNVDTNIINIEGSAVNNQAVLRANGLAVTDLKPNNGDAAVIAANPGLRNNPVPQPIRLGSGTGDVSMPNILFGTPASADFRGGAIRLVAAGQTHSTATLVNNANTQILSATEKSALNSRNNQVVQFNEGDVFNRSTIQADGALSKNGGTVIISAARHVVNSGAISANGSNSIDGVFNTNGNGGNGGNGGAIILTALGRVNNTATIRANGGNGARAQSRSLTTGNGQDSTVNITAVGGSGGQGGAILLSYGAPSTNSGTIQANGGIGGLGGFATATDTEIATSSNPNPIARATATGGRGGAGGLGGLILFSGTGNPTGGGSIQANGGQGGTGGNARAEATASATIGIPQAITQITRGAGGTGGAFGAVVVPVPGTFLSGQNLSVRAGGSGNSGSATFLRRLIRNGVAMTTAGSLAVIPGSPLVGGNRALITTRRNEYVRHADAAALLSQNSGAGVNSTTLTGRFADALTRTVANPIGVSGTALANAQSSNHFVISSNAPLALTNNLTNSNVDPRFFNLDSLTILNNGNLVNNMLWTPGVQLVGEGFHDIVFTLGGGNISWLANGNITNNNIVMTRGLWTGGGIQLAATQDVINNADLINIGPNKALLSAFNISGPLFEASHAGRLILKGNRDVINNSSGLIETNAIFFNIHPALATNPLPAWPRFLNGAQIGANVSMIAGRNLRNSGQIGANALTFRHGPLALSNPALTLGGIVTGRARTGTVTNNGIITATGNAFFSNDPNVNLRFTQNTFPATTSFAGLVDFP